MATTIVAMTGKFQLVLLGLEIGILIALVAGIVSAFAIGAW